MSRGSGRPAITLDWPPATSASICTVTSQPVNHVKNRMQALGLLDRSIKAATDDERLESLAMVLVECLDRGIEFVVGALEADNVRAAVKTGRIDGGMEAIAAVLTDACLAACIEALGDNAENPSTDQLHEVLPGLIDSYGIAVTRIMLAATVAGEAPASAIIRDVLKHDERLALPKADEPIATKVLDTSRHTPAEQLELRAKRAAAKQAKQEAARARKAQSAAARRR